MPVLCDFTPLMDAVNRGDDSEVKTLLENGANVNKQSSLTGDTALTLAAQGGRSRIVEILMQRGANVEARNKEGCTPMWLGCNGNHLDVAMALKTANVHAKDNQGTSCLMAAFKQGHLQIVRWLIRHVKEFPSDQEMSGIISEELIDNPELRMRAQRCMQYIKEARNTPPEGI